MDKAERIEEGNAGDDISAAWDELEEKDSGEDTEVQHTPEVSEAVEPTEHEPVDTAPADDDPEGIPGASEESAKEPVSSAPVGLPASAREEWSKTPKAMQEAIIKRERDFAVGIQKYAEGAKLAEQINSTLAPFHQYIAMNGGNTAEQVSTLFQTASQLQMGSPIQKAQTVANLISQFGVDIPELDRLLSGSGPTPERQNQDYIQQQIEQALAPYRQREQQEQQRYQQHQEQIQHEAGAEVNAFAQDASREFYREVRGDMADILDLAANRGIRMTMDEAYKRACALHPEVQKVLEARKGQQAIGRKKIASSSINGTLGGPGSTSAPEDLRGALEFAWDNTGRT